MVNNNVITAKVRFNHSPVTSPVNKLLLHFTNSQMQTNPAILCSDTFTQIIRRLTLYSLGTPSVLPRYSLGTPSVLPRYSLGKSTNILSTNCVSHIKHRLLSKLWGDKVI